MAGKYNVDNREWKTNKNNKMEYKNEGNFPEKANENEKGVLESLLR